MRAIAGHLPAQSGEVRLDGERISGLPPYRIAHAGVSYVPQGRDIFASFTVEENIVLGLVGKGLPKAVPDWAYDAFPILAERRRQRAGTMSGGQQQMLAILRALVGRPKLLLLDEPAEGIQPSIVREIGARLAEIARETSLTILVVEQNLDLVLDLARRVLFLENGRVMDEVADLDDLRSDPALVRRYLSV
jgi:ABC-type branched-subunit amino acid transport system ATPase component